MTDDTLLLRQIHPPFVQQGRVTSQAFRPTPKDRKRLSVYDGDMIDAESAWLHFTGVLGFSSVGALGVTRGECTHVGLAVRPDPEPFPEHAVIDFEDFEKALVERVAKKLRQQAELRGWLYRAA